MKRHSTFFRYSFMIALLTITLWSCEKEVVLIIPPAESQYVIEGKIEIDTPPFVLISQTRNYNEAISVGELDGFYLGGATVVVTNGELRDTLDEVCSFDLPIQVLTQIVELTGINPTILGSSNVCGYIDLDGSIIGAEGETYGLEVSINGTVLTAETSIPELVTLDSLWFEVAGSQPDDSLGFTYARLTDPEPVGNAYRWFAKRINHYPSWSARAGEQKDNQYIAPIGSSYDDTFFNGLSFVFPFFRGNLSGSNKPDDLNIESGFFKVGDTIAVKGTSIDRETYNYVVSFEAEAGSAGNPFTAPSPVYTNINGGLGVWAGYAQVYDTIIATP